MRSADHGASFRGISCRRLMSRTGLGTRHRVRTILVTTWFAHASSSKRPRVPSGKADFSFFHDKCWFWSTLSALVLQAQRSTGAETLQKCKCDTRLPGKIIPVQNELRGFENDWKNPRKMILRSGRLLERMSPCSRIILQAENASQYMKQLYELLQ